MSEAAGCGKSFFRNLLGTNFLLRFGGCRPSAALIRKKPETPRALRDRNCRRLAPDRATRMRRRRVRTGRPVQHDRFERQFHPSAPAREQFRRRGPADGLRRRVQLVSERQYALLVRLPTRQDQQAFLDRSGGRHFGNAPRHPGGRPVRRRRHAHAGRVLNQRSEVGRLGGPDRTDPLAGRAEGWQTHAAIRRPDRCFTANRFQLSGRRLKAPEKEISDAKRRSCSAAPIRRLP